MKKRRSIGWKIIIGCALLPITVLALLQTPPGKQLLVAALNQALRSTDSSGIRIGKISGWVPTAVQIDRLEVSDATGPWLTAEGVHFRWNMLDLRTRRIRLAAWEATRIELHRLPSPKKKSRPSARTFQPMHIVLDQVAIGQLTLGKAITGVPLDYAVRAGHMEWLPSGRLTGGLEFGGDAVGWVKLDGQLGGAAENECTLVAELDEWVRPAFGLDHLAGQLKTTLTSGGLHGTISATFRKGAVTGEFATTVDYAQRQLRLPHFNINGASLAATGDLSIDLSTPRKKMHLQADLTDGADRTYSMHTTAVLTPRHGSWGVDLQTLEIRGLAGVTASVAGTLSPDRLALQGTLAAFDLNALPIPRLSNFTGRVSGALALTGSLSNPVVRVDLEGMQWASAQEALDELPELNVHISGVLADGFLRSHSALTNSTTGQMTASLEMPCIFSLQPFIWKPAPDHLHVAFEADLDLGVFNQLALLNDQRVAGHLNAKLAYHHALSGSIRVEQGAYEHFRWGVVVDEVALDIAATDDRWQIQTATASAGGGEIVLTGHVGSNQVDLALTLHQAAFLRRDDVAGSFSGTLNLAGPLTRPLVSGALAVDRVDILLDHMAPALPPLLTPYDADAPIHKVEVVKKRPALPFNVDVQLDLSDQVFVNASMLDSVWGGAVRVQTVPAGLSVQGEVYPQRGYISFIGKKFRFTEGQIELDGAVPATPVINQVVAEYHRSDFTARLILNGRINNPSFRLESSPALPEDEVLSQVLFGRDTSSITPYQVYQIAAAARQLTRGMAGPGFMYQMRRAIGIDSLEWREGDATDDASILAAGKYLTPTLYVEINRSLDEKGDTGMMAEYEITKHFSVETSTGPALRPGIGINWKNDY